MIETRDFKFSINVSLDYYEKKTDAIACLSSAGSKAIHKDKMAFIEQKLTAAEFLSFALQGHTFCNLFEYEPDKKYWIKSGDKSYQSYPEYRNGPNKGAMKLCFKSDEFFRGSQVVFVDIDYTRFKTIPEYLNTLKFPPSCVYPSYSDNTDKHGVVSRRFRLVYIFYFIMDEEELRKTSRAVHKQVELCTNEPMEDDCGTRISQYMNGVFNNPEYYMTDCVYSPSDFAEFYETESNAVPVQQVVEEKHNLFSDEQMQSDMNNMSVQDFMHYYSVRYKYLYRVENGNWINNTYQLTEDNYLQLFWHVEPVKDGEHRRRRLFKRACLRRLMFPGIDADTLLFNLYVDVYRFFDNSDGVLTINVLVRKVTNAFKLDDEGLRQYCEDDITYWNNNRPKFIIHPSLKPTPELKNNIRREINYMQINENYDRNLSVRENAMNNVGPERTLYRFTKAYSINPNPNKCMTQREARENKRTERENDIQLFKRLYNPNISIEDNRNNLERNGLKLSSGTVYNWIQKYIKPEETVNQSTAKTQSDDDFLYQRIKIKDPFEGYLDNWQPSGFL